MTLLEQEEILSLRSKNEQLTAQVSSLTERVNMLLAEISELKSRLNKDSSNSSKPPSTDIVRTKSLRVQSGKTQGGQSGHKGSTLYMVDNPDKTNTYAINTCKGCGCDLHSTIVQGYDRRQVFDIPPIRMEVTEHLCEIKCCPHCQMENKGSFPVEVSQPTQYGNNLKRFCVYLSAFQMTPYERCSQLIRDLTGMAPSTGTLVNFNNEFRENLVASGFEEDLKKKIRASSVCHFDETGYYFDDNRNWLHTAATETLTYYFAHEKRGKDAMDAMNLLPQYTGTAVHDHWSSYMEYDCSHGLCNIHHLRDLTYCEEQENNEWAVCMIAMLLEMKRLVDECKENGMECMEVERVIALESSYDALVEKGYKQYPFPVKEAGKRGRVKKTKSQNLIERFKDHKDAVIRFVKDFNVPFGNNIAEQAIRMTKVKQKISGCFRSKGGAESFALARSYIDTMRKQGYNIMEAIGLAIDGNPIFA
jgi:transposase